LPPDAYAYTREGTHRSRVNIIDFWIPGLPEPLTVAHESDLIEFANDTFSVRNSVCGGYPVVDKRWKRTDGRMARRISADHTSIGYNWTTDPASVSLDKILDTWSCR
jgi:hypothetical protein